MAEGFEAGTSTAKLACRDWPGFRRWQRAHTARSKWCEMEARRAL